MTAIEFIKDLQNSGVTLEAIDGDLKIKGKRHDLSPDTLARIKDLKPKILEVLESRSSIQIPQFLSDQSPTEISHFYEFPGGQMMKLAAEEFNVLVEVFRILHAWNCENSPKRSTLDH